MVSRLTFLAIAGFWVTMNVLLWRSEYGSQSDDFPVPWELVWRKILTAPEASSLSVYQNTVRMGYCELSTGVGQQMATLDEDRPPPEGFLAKAGYQIHLSGNVAFGDFTNRVKFDGRLIFNSARLWREFTCRVTSRTAIVEVHSLATNQSVHIKVVSDGVATERNLTFDELQNPDAVVRAFAGNFADLLLGALDLPILNTASAQSLQWSARRTRIRIGSEPVPVYRLETSLLGRDVTVDVSTMGEILCVNFPGELTARIEELNRP